MARRDNTQPFRWWRIRLRWRQELAAAEEGLDPGEVEEEEGLVAEEEEEDLAEEEEEEHTTVISVSQIFTTASRPVPEGGEPVQEPMVQGEAVEVEDCQAAMAQWGMA